jgi:sec-independent protein translocase protein TatA
MGLSFGHLLVVLLLVFVLFGAGKLPRVMGDIGKGIRNLREGMGGGDDEKQQVLPPEDREKR